MEPLQQHQAHPNLHGHGGLLPSLHNSYSTILGSWQPIALGAYNAYLVVLGSLIVPLPIAPSVHSAQVVAYTLLAHHILEVAHHILEVAHHILEVAHLVH